MESPAAKPHIDHLWRDFSDELLSFAHRRIGSESEAEDILQAAFLKAHQQLESGLAPTNPRGWLYQIVRNLTIDTYRRRARRRETPESQVGLDLDAVEDQIPSDAELHEDVRAMVARVLPKLIDELQAPYREALRLTELEGLTQTEAAARAGLSVSGMKSRVQRARKKLLKALQECCFFSLDARNRVVGCDPLEDSDICSDADSCDDIP